MKKLIGRPRTLIWVFITCKCGKEFETSRSKRAKFCSKQCFYKYRTRPKGLTYKIISNNKGWFKFKGGTIDKKGYLQLQIKQGKIKRFHRLVMESYLQKELLPNEVIHHINGDKLDNRIENLQLLTKKQHDNFHNGKRRLGYA